MTTLPQTTSSRLPRPGGRTPATQTAQQIAAATATLTPGDVWRLLRANALMIVATVLVFVVLSIVVNEFIFKRYMPKYTAIADLEIRTPVEINPFPTGRSTLPLDEGRIDIRQATQAQKLKNPELWRIAISNPESPIRQTEWFRKKAGDGAAPNIQRVLDDLDRNLRVVPIADSKIIRAEFSCSNPTDAAVVLREILRRHIELDRDQNNASQNDEIRTLIDLESRANQRITQLSQTVNERAAALSMSGPTQQMAKYTSIGLLEAQISGLIGERLKVASELAVAKANLESLTQQIQAGEVPATVSMAVNADPDVTALRRQIEGLEAEIDVQSATLGANHDYVKLLQRRLDDAQRRYSNKVDELRLTITNAMMSTAQSELNTVQSNFDRMETQIAELQRRIGELTQLAADYYRAVDERQSEQNRLAQVQARLAVLRAQTTRNDANRSNVWWAVGNSIDGTDAVTRPEEMSFPKLWQTVAVAIVLGTGLSVGLAFLRELMDTSIRSPRDISRVGNFNLLGMVTHEEDDPQAAGSALPLVISKAPHALIAENFRQVRTRLQHSASVETTRSLLVTSPSPGDGKTTVACNLAAGLALNGKKILLVDANFRRPELHRVFGLPNDSGFGNVLSKNATIESVAKKTEVPGLSVLTSGPRPTNATELLESQNLRDFVEHALEHFDQVIFDTGPILLVSETVALAPRVDGVITVVRAKANSRGLLVRMREALRQLKAEHIGIVLNGVRVQGGGYYGRNIKSYYAYQNGNAN